MCGRYAIALERNEMIQRYGVAIEGTGIPEPLYNIAPTTIVPIVLDSARANQKGRRLEGARWSLNPSWSTELDLTFPTFNARIETAAKKPSFRLAVKNQRCIIPMTGYYEWKTFDGVKRPHFICQPADPEFVPRSGMKPDGLTTLNVAGLYSWWKPEDALIHLPEKRVRALDGAMKDGWLLTTTVLTRDAEGELANLHHRIPVMLPDALIDPWLDPSVEGSQGFLDDFSGSSRSVYPHLKFWEVPPLRGDSPGLIIPA